MITQLRFKRFLSLFVIGMFGINLLSAQNAVKDTDQKNDIMMQTFGWDEHQQPRITNAGGFYNYYNGMASYLSEAGVDMMWFPPASQSTGGVGYIPTKLYNFSYTSWGSEAQLNTMLTTYNNLQMYPIADIVVNHRGGTTGWVDFTEPTWPTNTICVNDDGGWTANPASGSGVTAGDLGANDTGEDFSGARDLDHTNTTVQNGIKEYLDKLEAKGFKGWRWDVAKGFDSWYFGMYIDHSRPYYSVGEYFDSNVDLLKGWVNGTAEYSANSTSGAFDFANYNALANAVNSNNSYGGLNSGGKMPGLAGQYGYDDKAVTFVDNHDTFVKFGAPYGDAVMRGYAYILTHPGIPCVWAPHYFGGTYTKDDETRTYPDNQDAINYLMGVRKQNGINAWSSVNIVEAGGKYAAYISPSYGTDATVAVKIGPGDWSPSGSGWFLNTSGTDYAVWSKKTITIPDGPDEIPVTISLIGTALSGWGTDVMMTSTDNENYTLQNQIFTTGEVKFRANQDWGTNWGGTAFPTGTGVSNSASNIPVTAGTYNVTFNRTTAAYAFTPSTGISETAENQIQVLPNPTTNNWIVNSNTTIEKVELFDISGKKIVSENVNKKSYTIAGKGLNAGMYFAVITTKSQVETIKVIKN